MIPDPGAGLQVVVKGARKAGQVRNEFRFRSAQQPISAILGTVTVIVWLFLFLAAFLESAKKRRAS
jgi:hypothetical protein